MTSLPAEMPVQSELFENLVESLNALGDGLDHPEIWQMLAELGAGDEADALKTALRQGWGDFGGDDEKTRNLALCVLIAAEGDNSRSMEALKQLEAKYALCPQVAGACFFVSRLHDPDRSADLSTKFCKSPFVKFETLIDGHVAPCCSIWTKKRLGHLEEQSFDEIWNGEEAVEMRESILDGSFRYCNKQRCTKILEDELEDRDAVTDPDLRKAIDDHQTVLDQGPKWLFLAHDVTCNLSCPSCRGCIIAADEEQEARFAKVEKDVLFPLLEADNPIKVSLSGQGDPWSSPHYRSILRHLADNDINAEVNLHTNALLMGEKRWSDYDGLEKYKPLVDVSIDACTPWVYEVVRRPGKWEKLALNLEFIAAKRKAGVFSEYHLNATIQLDNYHEIPALIDYTGHLGADSVRLYMMQNTGGHLTNDFPVKNVADKAHPLHLAFLETLRDPRLSQPNVHLYDVATWRDMARKLTLPSDALGEEWNHEDLSTALLQHIENGALSDVVALCAAGRIRFHDDINLLHIEALALGNLGFEQQARYREHMAEAVMIKEAA